MIEVIGRPLKQWELGRKIRILADEPFTEVHFAQTGDAEALVVEPKEENGVIVADIPNILLQSHRKLFVWLVLSTDDSKENVEMAGFYIETKPKPSDYVYTETEIKNYEALEKRIKAIEASGGGGGTGADGKDGVGIESVIQTTTSTEDGGVNVVTVTKTDGEKSTFEVRNGSKGSKGDKGDKGADGYTPQKGVDYFDGEDGHDGKDGLDGKTPVKGTDYFTEAEKRELVEDVVDSIGTGTVVTSVEPKVDDIPKIFFDEAIPQEKIDATTKFRYISKTMDFEGYAEFKAQGNSSMRFPKKNMTVKMYKDEALEEKLKVDFKGWGEQSKHVYKANWIDLLHARNVVSARIWADVVKSRANYLALPELYRTSPNQGAVDGFPVKVYSQGIYQGRYTLNIPKDAWMSNMDDELDNHCILCGENYASGCFRALANIDGNDWSDEVHDNAPTSIKTRWNEIISFVMNSTDEDFKANLGNYFFVDSLIDYFIFGMVSCGLDAFGKNQLYFTYDGLKWIAGMYDMDSTWGLYWNGSKFVSASYTREQFEDFVSTASSGDGNLLYIRLAKLFYSEIQNRYEELKRGVLSIPNLINHFERFTDIAPLDLVKEDYASTTGGGRFTGIPSKDTNNIQQIRKFVVDRYAYCDEYFASLGESGGEEPETPTDKTLSSISATYSGGDVVVGTTLTSLTGITVTGTWSDGSTSTITGYTLTGEIVEGSNTITVSYNDLTTTFTVIGYVAEDIPSNVNMLKENYSPNGEKFMLYDGAFDLNTQKIVIDFDMSTCEEVIENLISVGENISAWNGNHIHFMHTPHDNAKDALKIGYPTGAGSNLTQVNLFIVPQIHIELTKNGLFINNTLQTGYDYIVGYFKTINTIQIGSQEGKNRSHAIYNYVYIADDIS